MSGCGTACAKCHVAHSRGMAQHSPTQHGAARRGTAQFSPLMINPPLPPLLPSFFSNSWEICALLPSSRRSTCSSAKIIFSNAGFCSSKVISFASHSTQLISPTIPTQPCFPRLLFTTRSLVSQLQNLNVMPLAWWLYESRAYTRAGRSPLAHALSSDAVTVMVIALFNLYNR